MIKSVKKYWLSDVSFVSQMFVLAFLVFVLPILIEEGYYYPLLIQAIFLLLLLSGLFYEHKNNLIWIALILMGLQVFLFVNDFLIDKDTNFMFNIVTLLNVLLFIYINVRLLFRGKCINFYRIIGALNIYMLIAVYVALTTGFIHHLKGGSISGNIVLHGNESDYAQFMYFSLTSLTTVGFGDIVAENMAVKMLAVFLSAAGMLFPAIVLARLVSLVDKEPEILNEQSNEL
jgi:hypothetical protein